MTKPKKPLRLPMCPCGKERVRAAGQGYGKKCHNRTSREYRAKKRAELEALRAIASKHGEAVGP